MGVSHGSFPEGWDHRAGPSSRSTSSHHSPVPPSSHPCLAICPCPLPGPHGSPPALLQLALALTNAATNLPTSAQPQPWNAACFQEVLKLLRWKFFEDPVVVFFFFQEKRGIFVRKHHHSIQGNNTPGTGGFHGQGSAGHVPQSHPQGPDLLRGHPEAAKPPVSRHQEATPGLGQTKLASDVPRGHRKGKYFSSVTFMGKSWKELQQGLGSTCVKAEQ